MANFTSVKDGIDAAAECVNSAACRTGDKDEILNPLECADWALEAMRQAILARLSGEWDDPSLMELGPLSTNPLEDVKRILGR